jgi:DNA-binding GntR family transcriptional regulator
VKRTYEAQDLLTQQASGDKRVSDGVNGVAALYTRLRTMILDGVFSPGATLSQVKLAESLGVSRIPLREALRMLQQEGLIEAEYNQRARVPSFTPAIVDSLYASRILLEALSIRLTVPRFDQADVMALKQTLVELDTVAAHIDLDAWEVPHRQFHALLVAHTEDSMRQNIASYANQCEYYRRLYHRLVSTQQPMRSAEAIAAEHHALAEAWMAGKADLAASLLTRHYARTALTVLGQMTPEFDPIAIRMALHIVGADTPLADLPSASKHVRKEAQMNGTRSRDV